MTAETTWNTADLSSDEEANENLGTLLVCILEEEKKLGRQLVCLY